MNSKYNILITQRAYSDIAECVIFVKNVSQDAALRLYEEIIESINSLADFPGKYPEITTFKIKENKVRKMPIHDGRYIILYKVEENNIVVYDILDCRKDNSLLKGL